MQACLGFEKLTFEREKIAHTFTLVFQVFFILRAAAYHSQRNPQSSHNVLFPIVWVINDGILTLLEAYNFSRESKSLRSL